MKRRRNRQKLPKRELFILLAVIVVLVLLYVGGRLIEQRMEKPEVRGDYTQRYGDENLVEYEGETYVRRNDVVTILLMGIDRRASMGPSVGYRSGGQADFLRLLVIDSTEKKISQVGIDRDTMTPITILGALGNQSGIRTAQISLSHGFGDGKEQSCELTADAVSNLLYTVGIDFYMALNMDGISVLNDMMGGITVTLKDDFSMLDPAMTSGTTLTLMGEQAEIYTRQRIDIGEGTNESRMVRQEDYIGKMAAKLMNEVRDDKEFVGKIYDELSSYLITDMPRGRLINEVWAAKDYDHSASYALSGEHMIGSDGFMQFYVDEAQLKKLVMDLFYKKLK